MRWAGRTGAGTVGKSLPRAPPRCAICGMFSGGLERRRWRLRSEVVVIIILTVNSISDYKVLGGDERGGAVTFIIWKITSTVYTHIRTHKYTIRRNVYIWCNTTAVSGTLLRDFTPPPHRPHYVRIAKTVGRGKVQAIKITDLTTTLEFFPSPHPVTPRAMII